MGTEHHCLVCGKYLSRWTGEHWVSHHSRHWMLVMDIYEDNGAYKKEFHLDKYLDRFTDLDYGEDRLNWILKPKSS